MPVSNSNTKVEFEAAYRATAKLLIKLQQYNQGSIVAGKIAAAEITATQALVNAVETALEPLGQDAS